MASILLYTASISQIGSDGPVATIGPDKVEISGSWSRLNTGFYKLSRGSGLYFAPMSGSTMGMLSLSVYTTTTSSFACYTSGSDSSSIYLKTFSTDNLFTPIDNALSGSAFNLDIRIVY